MTDKLFANWLAETRKLQIEAFNNDPAALDGAERDAYLMWNSFALIKEIGEAMDETSWKPWASEIFFNRDPFVKEMVDVLHFAANMLVAAGATDEELDALYRAKMDVNRERQLKGYTGTADKCPSCRRSFDDVGRSNILWYEDHTKRLCNLCADNVVGLALEALD